MPVPRAKCEDRRAAFAFRCFPRRIDIPVGLRKQSLNASQMSRRLANVLRRSGIRVLGDLQGRKVGDFARKRNCGFNTLYELDSLTRGPPYRAVALRGRVGEVGASHKKAAIAASFTIPESVWNLKFDELPITRRLASVVESIGARTLGDLYGRNPRELLR